ncbi:SPRY domain containing protein [uncultured Caudovirales phage]|uniref:SPRY domain containing protein n=1 Tax=uncultured Caudovirales phage TaxID=2100421 RepID=A0A6J7WKN4_9CAUD|nr:SPRY domain containing protein [uncultured Caudovirales phage]
MFPVLSANGPSGFTIANSLRFQSASSTYANRTPAAAGNRQKWTWSAWVKRGGLTTPQFIMFSATSGTGTCQIGFQGSGNDGIVLYDSSLGPMNVTTTPQYRDPSAWYHIVIAVDTTQATAANRVLMYVNGVQVTAFSTATYPSQNANTGINNNVTHGLGTQYSNGSNAGNYFDGYMAEVNFIDGQALTPSSFGTTDATSGQWIAKKYSGTYGTNGFYLPFSNGTSTTTLGADSSGNSNNWTLTNFTRSAGVSDCWMTDVPSGNSSIGGNYCVMNPLQKGGSVSASSGNLTVVNTADSKILGTIGMSSGKWYWEATVQTATDIVGIALGNSTLSSFTGGDANSWGYYFSNGNKYNSGSATAYGASCATGDVVGIAFDADAGTLTFYKNNTSQGTAYSSLTSGPYFPCAGNGNANTVYINFGQRSFAYTPPTGFKALCTANLPVATIKQGNKYMDATLYTGNNTANRTIVNAGGFKPDLVWLKSRSSASWANFLQDSVRGFPEYLISNSSGAAGTTVPNIVTSAATNGFVIEANGNSNNNGDTYVGWQWQAGQGSTSSNTNGSITSTTSVNATAGFSVVTWTGNGVGSATVGHGLGVTPAMVISKGRSYSNDWWVGHKGASTGILQLNSTNAVNSSSGTNGSLGFQQNYTSTVFGFNNGSSTINNANQNGITYVAYCFAEIAGFSKFGSYTGNGSADGTFVYLGFRPKYVMVKYSSSADNWDIFDSVRNPYNLTNNKLYANLSDAESADAFSVCDLLSNGFKLRGTGNQVNANGGTYIYMAFAENPFAQANAR